MYVVGRKVRSRLDAGKFMCELDPGWPMKQHERMTEGLTIFTAERAARPTATEERRTRLECVRSKKVELPSCR